MPPHEGPRPACLDYTRVAVVIPALNEEASLPLVLSELPDGVRVFVVDNGSTDRTAEVAGAAGATVITEPRKGYGSACLSGIAAAAAVRPEVLVILDADHSDDTSQLARLVAPVLNNTADFVLSDRTRLADRGALMPQQRYGNALATRLIARATGHRYRDMGPFRAIRYRSLLSLDLVDTNYGWNVEMQIKAVRAGLRVREIDVPYHPRIGTSKISGTVSGTFQAGVKIIWSVWRYGR